MRRDGFIVKKLASKVVLGSLLLASAKVYADAPAPKWYDTIAASGYLQGSYVGNLDYSGNHNPNNVGRAFDTNGNSFNLNRFLLQLAKPVGDSDHYGFTVRLAAGQDATVLNTAAGWTSSDVNVQEAYLTYAVPSMTKLQFTAGKFVTPEGFEGVDSVNNPNFSEGLLFTAMEPITHTGIKANYTFSDKANATIGLVNGWDLVQDNNSAKTLLWQLATTPTKQISWSFQGLYGKELADPSHAERLSLDTVLGFNPTDKLSLNAQLNWYQQSNDPTLVAVDRGTALGTTHATGAGIWASYATTSKFTEIVRYEVLSDEDGANRFGSATFGNELAPGTGTDQTVQEFTLTHKTMLTSNLGTRLEYRHDWSNEAAFMRNTGGAVRNQNTISMDWFVTF